MEEKNEMNVFELICGILSTIIGGYSSWWLISNIWIGVTTSNWQMVVGVGILAYLLLSITLVLFFFGLVLIVGGLFD